MESVKLKLWEDGSLEVGKLAISSKRANKLNLAYGMKKVAPRL